MTYAVAVLQGFEMQTLLAEPRVAID